MGHDALAGEGSASGSPFRFSAKAAANGSPSRAPSTVPAARPTDPRTRPRPVQPGQAARAWNPGKQPAGPGILGGPQLGPGSGTNTPPHAIPGDEAPVLGGSSRPMSAQPVDQGQFTDSPSSQSSAGLYVDFDGPYQPRADPEAKAKSKAALLKGYEAGL